MRKFILNAIKRFIHADNHPGFTGFRDDDIGAGRWRGRAEGGVRGSCDFDAVGWERMHFSHVGDGDSGEGCR